MSDTRVIIEFSTPEKAESFRQAMEHNGFVRWDNYDDDAYDYVEVVDPEEAE